MRWAKLLLALTVVSVACNKREGSLPVRRPSVGIGQPATMSAAEIKSKVLKIVADQCGVKQSDLRRETSLKSDLKTDDLDEVELIMELEDSFGLTISDDDASRLRTVGQIIDYVQARRGQR